jgi:hypothetical protein
MVAFVANLSGQPGMLTATADGVITRVATADHAGPGLNNHGMIAFLTATLSMSEPLTL